MCAWLVSGGHGVESRRPGLALLISCGSPTHGALFVCWAQRSALGLAGSSETWESQSHRTRALKPEDRPEGRPGSQWNTGGPSWVTVSMAAAAPWEALSPRLQISLPVALRGLASLEHSLLPQGREDGARETSASQQKVSILFLHELTWNRSVQLLEQAGPWPHCPSAASLGLVLVDFMWATSHRPVRISPETGQNVLSWKVNCCGRLPSSKERADAEKPSREQYCFCVWRPGQGERTAECCQLAVTVALIWTVAPPTLCRVRAGHGLFLFLLRPLFKHHFPAPPRKLCDQVWL